MNDKRRATYYLATTGISEIWDLDCNLLFLGPWCLTSEKNRKLIDGKDYIIVPSPWKPANRIKDADEYCHQIYEELLPKLTEELNTIHQVSCPIRYWRVLIGPWLYRLIGILYDRFHRIKLALETFPDLYTNVLPLEQCKLVTFDMYDFRRVNEDYYNLKLFSYVCHELCAGKIVEKDYKTESKIYSITRGWKRRLFNKIIKPLDFIKYLIVLSDMQNLSFWDMFLLKWKIGFRIIHFGYFYSPQNLSLLNDHYNPELRRTISLKGSSDRFQTLLYKLLPDAIPMCYMENYQYYQNCFKKNISVKMVGSATGWYFNESFKFFAANSVLNGSKLIDFQHGGGYGISLSIPPETISLEKDIFCSWGWTPKNWNNVKPLPNPFLSRLKNTHSQKLDDILLVTADFPRYQYKFETHLFPDDIPKYFEDKKIFLRILAGEIKNRILYRLYPRNEYGWSESREIKKVCPQIRFIDNGKLVNWMQKVKLVVIDHPHTSFLEALTINVPSVFYWDHDVYFMRSEAEEYFELLRKAGILYKDPISAANKVNEIYGNILSWWRQPEVQAARNEFCQRFAMTSENWLNDWAAFFRTLKKAFQ